MSEERPQGRSISDWCHEFLDVHHETINQRGEVEVVCNCFVCGAAQKLWINATSGMWGCYRCGTADKTTIELVMQVQEVSYGEAFRLVRQMRPVRESRVAKEARLQTEDFEAPRAIEIPRGLRPAWDPLHWYLEDRGITAETAERWQLHFCPMGRFGNRIVIPTIDRGTWVAFAARTVKSDQKVKYLAEKQAGVVGVLGLDLHFLEEHLVLQEGPFDAMWTDQHGWSAIPCEGKSLSIEKLSKIKHAGVKKLTVMFDSDDEEADHNAIRLCQRAAELFSDVGWAPLLEPGLDPAQATPAQLEAAFAKRHWPTEREAREAERKAKASRARKLQKALEESGIEDHTEGSSRVRRVGGSSWPVERVDRRRRP